NFRAAVHVVVLLVLLLLRQGAIGQVRISEFLVSNTTGLLDQDGTPQPWVEIWNANRSTSQSLQNWRLTDGTSQWIFPAVSLPPNERIVVFLSGKNRSVVSAPLHTSFTLNPAGGTLRLHDSAGAVVKN